MTTRREEDFQPTHMLVWHRAQTDVAVTPSMMFEAKTGDGKGKMLTPAYTRDEWETRGTAQWTTDGEGSWYLFGERVRPQPEARLKQRR